jgi:hypothetical protein
MSCGLTPARSKASFPATAAGPVVMSGHWLVDMCIVHSPAPSTQTGFFGRSATRSSATRTTAAPPSDLMQQCSLVNGSAIIGPLRTSSMVIGSR